MNRGGSGSLRGRSLAACGLAFALTAPGAVADHTEELARLREEAAQIRQSLNKLEAKIQALESEHLDQGERKDIRRSQEPSREPTPMNISSLVSLKKNWSQIQPGTPEDKVQALLGKPEKALRIDGSLVWYYIYPGIGRGSVFFNGDGRVSTTQSPGLGW